MELRVDYRDRQQYDPDGRGVRGNAGDYIAGELLKANLNCRIPQSHRRGITDEKIIYFTSRSQHL